MNKIVKLFSGIVLLASVVTMNACKKSFDNPPAPSDNVNIVANTSIATLKSLHAFSGAYDVINSDIIISGIVTANDKSGNLYKQIFIHDTTGAMQILIEASSVYGTFPVGRRVFIRCKGLCITDYHGTMEVGMLTQTDAGPAVQGILSSDIGKYIVGGSLNNDVTPIPVTASDLGTNMQDRYINELIRLDDYEFQAADTAFTYSDTSAYKNTLNRTIKNCTGSTVLVRNSAYANFTAVPLPKGHGDIAAIYTIYKSTPTSTFPADKQLLLRDTSDVHFYGDRCGSTIPPGARITIAQLRALYAGSNIKITTPTSIGGVVISDAANKNVSSGTVILQEGNAGISVYFGGTITYHIGDSIIINITGDSLLNYHGSLEIKTPFNTTPPAVTAANRVIVPAVHTISEMNTALSTALSLPTNIEFTMVTILNATASGGGTYAGNRTLTDASGNMTLYTAAAALFGASSLPTTPKNWTGYANTYNSTKELQIRNLSDVQ